MDIEERSSKEDGVPNEDNTDLMDAATAAEETEDTSQENGGGEFFVAVIKYSGTIHTELSQSQNKQKLLLWVLDK